MNATISYVSRGFQFTGIGPEWAGFVHTPTDIIIVYPDTGAGIHTDTITAAAAQKVNLDGSLATITVNGVVKADVTINRVTNSWLLCVKKGNAQLLIIQEYLFTSLDGILGGDQEYAILGRVLHHQIVPFQNV